MRCRISESGAPPFAAVFPRARIFGVPPVMPAPAGPQCVLRSRAAGALGKISLPCADFLRGKRSYKMACMPEPCAARLLARMGVRRGARAYVPRLVASPPGNPGCAGNRSRHLGIPGRGAAGRSIDVLDI